MANEHTRLLIDPDTGETVPTILSDEDAARASSDETFLRTTLQSARATMQSKTQNREDLRGAKVQAAIQQLTDDLAAFDTATPLQRLAMQKRLTRYVLVIIRELAG